jgi:sugar phosphate isomerase/epimerase
MKLSACDFTFPKLDWEQTIRLGRDLGVEAMDISLFKNRSHLDPGSVLVNSAPWAARVTSTLGANGLGISDVFGQAGTRAEESALNDPDEQIRHGAAEFFHRILEFSLRCNCGHLTILPGIHFKEEPLKDSLKRSAEELSWRVETARNVGIVLGIEPHIGSVSSTPGDAACLLEMTPGLTFTLDYCHFACQGIPDDKVEPLLARTSHFHARGACKAKLQAAMKENAIDYLRVLRAMKRIGYRGFIALEYVWLEWMRCNEVDNISETILLRDVLRAADAESNDLEADLAERVIA